jgi:hypothetical protein
MLFNCLIFLFPAEHFRNLKVSECEEPVSNEIEAHLSSVADREHHA